MTVPIQHQELDLTRCSHCSIASPRLEVVWETNTRNSHESREKHWAVYRCSSCGGLILTGAPGNVRNIVQEMYPDQRLISEAVPERARAYLLQAIESIHAPAGAVMLTASAVDAMLKVIGYKDGSLNDRIERAAAAKLLTEEMAMWAHEIRLDANDQRHADEAIPIATQEDAERILEFAFALAEFIFILPERVRRGRKNPVPVTK